MMGAARSRGAVCPRPVGPHVPTAVTAACADHASPERPDDRFVGEVIGVHRGLVIAGDRIAVDEQLPDAMAADVAQRHRLECLSFARGRHAVREMPGGAPGSANH
jgi:hypothetical protein